MRAEDIITVVAFYNEALLLQLNSTKCRMIILRPLAPPRLFPSVCLSVCEQLSRSVNYQWQASGSKHQCIIYVKLPVSFFFSSLASFLGGF